MKEMKKKSKKSPPAHAFLAVPPLAPAPTAALAGTPLIVPAACGPTASLLRASVTALADFRAFLVPLLERCIASTVVIAGSRIARLLATLLLAVLTTLGPGVDRLGGDPLKHAIAAIAGIARWIGALEEVRGYAQDLALGVLGRQVAGLDAKVQSLADVAHGFLHACSASSLSMSSFHFRFHFHCIYSPILSGISLL